MAGAGVLGGLVLIWWSRGAQDRQLVETAPFRLTVVLQFALLLALIASAGELIQRYLGDAGIYALAGFSGLAEADAVTVSLASMARGELAPVVAARAVVLVAMAAALSKTLLATALGGGLLARRVAAASLLMIVSGLPWLF